MAVKKFGSVEGVSITILVDNKANLIVESNEVVEYFTKKPLLAEHGFSAWVQLDDSEERILWDAGVSETALIENMRLMELDFGRVSQIALSHGHFDHYAAMTAFLNEMNILRGGGEWGESVSEEELGAWVAENQVPLAAHPAAFRERWWRKDDNTLAGPYTKPPRGAWEAAGARITLSESPYKLGEGCWTTGYVPRKSFETSGRPARLLYRDGLEFIKDDLEEDQAIVINVKGKGLVVLSGCAHAGIVNTVKYAQAISGVERVYAVLGGFHMARASEEEIEGTMAFFKELDPVYLIPSHCTGFEAISRFAQEMPEAFIEGVVGARYLF